MKKYCLLSIILFWLLLFPALPEVSSSSFLKNNDRQFRFVHQVVKSSQCRVALSQILDAHDVLSGKQDYFHSALAVGESNDASK